MKIKVLFSAQSGRSTSDKEELEKRLKGLITSEFADGASLTSIRRDPINAKALQAFLTLPDGTEKSFVAKVEEAFSDDYSEILAYPEGGLAIATLIR